jgi:hypothetical protein
VGAPPATARRQPSRLAKRSFTALRAWCWDHRLEAGFIVAGLLARVLFWQITERKFEDGLITITHARNAVEGAGLTHHPFEEVTHGFTSAISVLVPLLGELLTFLPKFDGYFVLRLTTLLAFVATILGAWAIAERLSLGRWPRVVAYGYLALSFNQIYYGMAGMETQIAVAVLLWAVAAALYRQPSAAGVLYGLCVLARPDFVLFVGPALVWWLLHDRRAAVRVAALAGVVVAPWLVFTTLYYGSPLPNTIHAKALRYPIPWPDSLSPGAWWDFVASQVGAREGWLWRTLSPFWEHVFVIDAPVLQTFATWFAGALVVLAVTGAVGLWREFPAMRPAVTFAGLFVAYRLLALPESYYDWYYPPLTAVVLLFAAYAVHRVAVWFPRIAVVSALTVALSFAVALPALFVLEERYQHDVENQARFPLGMYLRDHVPEGTVVTSESAGYVGYYSAGNIKLWDYPGLTSKEAFAIMEALGEERNNLQWLAHAALPDYAVWRPDEAAAFAQAFPDSAALYEEVARFTAPVTEDDLAWGGVRFAVPDDEFIVMRRVRGSLGGVERARRLVAGG